MSSNTTIYQLLEVYKNFDASVYFPKEPLEPLPHNPDIDMDFEDDQRSSWGWRSGEANINYGGHIARAAWANGSYDHIDMSELAKKSWKNRDRGEAQAKMYEGHLKWREENPEAYSELQRKAALAAWQNRRLKQIKLKYRGNIYYGWSELSRATGRSKWFLQKDNEVTIV